MPEHDKSNPNLIEDFSITVLFHCLTWRSMHVGYIIEKTGDSGFESSIVYSVSPWYLRSYITLGSSSPDIGSPVARAPISPRGGGKRCLCFGASLSPFFHSPSSAVLTADLSLCFFFFFFVQLGGLLVVCYISTEWESSLFGVAHVRLFWVCVNLSCFLFCWAFDKPYDRCVYLIMSASSCDMSVDSVLSINHVSPTDCMVCRYSSIGFLSNLQTKGVFSIWPPCICLCPLRYSTPHAAQSCR